MNDSRTDLELLQLWQAGDNHAGSALVKRHFKALHRFLVSKVNSHAEDLIQQTFVACVEARDAFRGESSFRAYLFGLARFQLYRHYRDGRYRSRTQCITTSVRDQATSPSGVVVRHEERQLLLQAMQRVPVDQQIALELTYWNGMAAPELAHVLGVPENTVYSRLSRAKAQLRQVLGELSSEPATCERAIALLDASAVEE